MPPLKLSDLGNRLRGKRAKWLLFLSTIAVVILALAIPLYVTSRTSFFVTQKSLKPRYETWRKSSHKGVACIKCHVKPGVSRAVSYHINNVRKFYSNLVFGSERKATLNKSSSGACLGCHEGTTSIKANSRIPLIPHRIHTSPPGPQENCVECHKWVAHDEKFQKRHKSLPLTGVCFKYGCHGEVKPIEECQSCHHRESISNTDWRKQHRDVVNARGANRCFDYCHKPDWCRSCHLTGEKAPMAGVTAISIQPSNTLISQHAGKEWLKFHGQEALENSRRCLACHANFQLCRSCHSIRPTSHGRKETWLAQHEKPAKKGERGCLTCHQKKVCDRCHELFKEVGR